MITVFGRAKETMYHLSFGVSSIEAAEAAIEAGRQALVDRRVRREKAVMIFVRSLIAVFATLISSAAIAGGLAFASIHGLAVLSGAYVAATIAGVLLAVVAFLPGLFAISDD